jgi:hypothetical protein
MGRVRGIGIKAAIVTAVSAAVLATITVPASAAGVGVAIQICNSNSMSGRVTIEGRNQHNKPTTSPTFYYPGNGCTRLRDWWWIAPGVSVFFTRDNGVQSFASKSITEKDYNKWVTVNLSDSQRWR